MRAGRAYLAGLGTAGALVVGAAVLFTLASALVAFNGWPKLADGSLPATQLLTAQARAHAKQSHRAASASRTTVAAVKIKVSAGARHPHSPAPVAPRSGATRSSRIAYARSRAGSSTGSQPVRPLTRPKVSPITRQPATPAHRCGSCHSSTPAPAPQPAPTPTPAPT
ncbi:MAG: hypothetical protein ACRDMX_15395, partial [Solirubrobacteraceae bacterium]